MDDDIFELVESLARKAEKQGEADGEKDSVLKHKQEGFAKGWKQACQLSFELSSLHCMLSFVLSGRKQSLRHTPAGGKNPDHLQGGSGGLPPRLEKKCHSLLKQIENRSLWLDLNDQSEEALENKLASLQKEVQIVLSQFNIISGIENPGTPSF